MEAPEAAGEVAVVVLQADVEDLGLGAVVLVDEVGFLNWGTGSE